MTAGLLNWLSTFAMVLMALVPSGVMGMSCLDDAGNAVDGWTLLKGDDDYIIYNYTAPAFVQSPFEVDQTSEGAIMRTLKPLYDNTVNSTYAYVMYNDDPPEASAASATYAHAKGILAVDSTQGFWLVHSMPNWPEDPIDTANPGIFPSNTYGQSLRCVTIDLAAADSISNGLRIDYPKVYAHNLPVALETPLNHMKQLIDRDRIGSSFQSNVSTFTSIGGTKYYQAAKSKDWSKDLWDDLVAPYFETPMYVETWIKGAGGRMSSTCYNVSDPAPNQKVNTYYDIYQVSRVTMPNGATWKNTEDHSKWGIAKASEIDNNQVFDSKVVCIGDINRMCSQENRGGGALCMEDSEMHAAFKSIIGEEETCYLKDPCAGTSTQCYWCNNTALTYPPTFYPTQLPVTAAPTVMATIAPTTATSTLKSGTGLPVSNQVVGAIAGSIALLAVIGIGIFYTSRKNKNKSLAGEDEESSTRPRRSSFEVDHPYDVKKNDKRLSYSQRIAGMFKPPPPPNRRGAPPTNTSTNNNNCRRPASPTNQPPAPPKPPKPSQQGSGVLSDDDGENGINNPFLSDDI